MSSNLKSIEDYKNASLIMLGFSLTFFSIITARDSNSDSNSWLVILIIMSSSLSSLLFLLSFFFFDSAWHSLVDENVNESQKTSRYGRYTFRTALALLICLPTLIILLKINLLFSLLFLTAIIVCYFIYTKF